MRFIVIGCGRWGSEIARVLVVRGHEVAVVDPDPRTFERLGPAFAGARHHVWDARETAQRHALEAEHGGDAARVARGLEAWCRRNPEPSATLGEVEPASGRARRG